MLGPMNYPAGTPGSGFIVLESKKCKVAVVNHHFSLPSFDVGTITASLFPEAVVALAVRWL